MRPFWTLSQQLPRPEPREPERLTWTKCGLLLSKAQIAEFKEHLPPHWFDEGEAPKEMDTEVEQWNEFFKEWRK